MELLLFKTFKKRTDSTKLVDISKPDMICDVYLKRETVYSEPVFTIESQEYPVYTYAYLVPTQSFYFVRSRKQQNVGYWEIGLKLDPLATYRAEIAAYECFVERCSDSKYYRENFNDPLVSVSQNVVNFDMAVQPISQFSSNNGCYVLRIAGGDADGVSTFVTNNLASLAAIFDVQTYLTSDAAWFEKFGNIVFDPWDYVIDFAWSPLKLSFYTDNGAFLSHIYVKWVDTGISAYKLPNNKIAYANTGAIPRPAALYGDFRKYNPNFTRYKLFIPAVGLVDMDNNEADGALRVSYTIALDTGSATVDVIRDSDLTRIAHYSSELYSPLQGGNTKINAGAVVSDVGSSVAGFLTENVGKGAAGIVSAIGNIIKPTPQMLGSAGGIGVRADTSVYFISECYQSGAIPVEVAGRPCYRNLVLGNLTGFIKCGNPSIELAAESDVIDEVNNYLANGFYFE